MAQAKTPDEFRAAVLNIAAKRNDYTAPGEGWPWPWNDSNTTDYAYMLIDGAVKVYVFGCECFTNEDGKRDHHDEKTGNFPDMSARKNVQWGAKSGLIVVSA